MGKEPDRAKLWGWWPAGLTAAVLAGLAAAPGAGAACGDPGNNEIVIENCRAGSPPEEWDISGAGDPAVQGFATDISVDQGGTAQFKIDASAPYALEIFRLGYYGGAGARRVDSLGTLATQDQPACNEDADTGLVDCGNWAVSASWTVPADAVSGIYLAVTKRDGSPASHIPFVVRDDDGRSDLLFQTSDTTWQAYNAYGGNSLYRGDPVGRAYKVSYNRPFTTADNAIEDWLFNSEYPMVRWLERNGYDVSYFTGVDSDRRGAEIREHRAFLSVGHDEYWSGVQRANVEAARDAGVNLAFFSGNEVFWKTRWEASIAGCTASYRTLVSYKETHANAKIDPTSSWTGTWRDPRFSPDGGRPENALTGTAFLVNSGSRAIEVPADDGKLRFWRDTSVANLAAGDTETLTSDTLGYEWDGDLDNGARPAGLVRLSTTTAPNVQILTDYGSSYDWGSATHHLTLYRDTNGSGPDALVFGAGTIQWPWGLDSTHERGNPPTSLAMQQATTNLFADMGVQPASLQPELQRATASTDTTPPSTTINGPPTITVTNGVSTTIEGSAADGGGRVGAVEVSVDGGASWHPAAGRETWSYRWTPSQSGQVTPLARAADDSGNLSGSSANPEGGAYPADGGGTDDCGTPPGGGGTPPDGGGTPPGGTGGSTVTPGAGTQGTQPGGSSPRTGTTTSPDVPVTRAVDISTRSVRMSRRGTVRLRIACPPGERDCRVQLRLRRDGRSIAHRTFSMEGGDARRIALKLNRATRRALIRKGSLRVTAVAAVAGGGTTRATIRLLAPGQG
jgi:hypothetical protein